MSSGRCDLEYSDKFKRMVVDFCRKRRSSYFKCRERWKYRSGGWSIYKDVEHVLNSVEGYDKEYVEPLMNFISKSDKKLLLDVGCGWGALEVSLAMRNIEIVGVEIDKDAIKLAKALVHEHGVKEKVCFILADACRLPFRDKVFDGVVSIGVFEHIPKVEDAIKEGWRVLKNMGVLFLMTPNRLFPYDFHDTNLPFIHWLPHRIATSLAYALRRIDPSHMPQTSEGVFELNRFLTRWEILRILPKAEAEPICPNWKIMSKNEVGHSKWRSILRSSLEKSIIFSPTLNLVIRLVMH